MRHVLCRCFMTVRSNGTVKGIEVLFHDDPDQQLADDMQTCAARRNGL